MTLSINDSDPTLHDLPQSLIPRQQSDSHRENQAGQPTTSPTTIVSTRQGNLQQGLQILRGYEPCLSPLTPHATLSLRESLQKTQSHASAIDQRTVSFPRINLRRFTLSHSDIRISRGNLMINQIMVKTKVK